MYFKLYINIFISMHCSGNNQLSPTWKILKSIKLPEETKNTTSSTCELRYLMCLTS